MFIIRFYILDIQRFCNTSLGTKVPRKLFKAIIGSSPFVYANIIAFSALICNINVESLHPQH